MRIDGVGGGLRRRAKHFGFGRTAFSSGLGLGNPARPRLRAAEPDTRLGHDAIGEPVCHQRRRNGEIAGPAVEFMETEAGLVGR